MNTSISRINISNFRNYEAKSFSFSKQFVIITGANGSGKTNVLEAISLLSPGKGLRKANNCDFQNINCPTSIWGVSVDLTKDEMIYKLGTGIITPTSNRRVMKINGESIKSRTEVKEYLSIIWLTPQMDKIFIESKSERRCYFDKMMTDLYPKLAIDFFEYDKAMRERTRILKDGIEDTIWLENLEKIMVNKGLIISAARIKFCQQLNEQIQSQDISGFPKGEINISGDFEDLLKKNFDIEEASNILFKQYINNRSRDAVRGGASIGSHRADFSVIYLDKNMPASLCSTGEQKALLISIFLSFATELKHKESQAPIVLLDELIAHLDEDRKSSLFKELEILSSQVFMTGTNMEDFAGLSSAESEIIQL